MESTASTTLTSNTYTVTKNIIHDVVEERTFSAVGIQLATTAGGSATNNLVANNFIYNIRANATTGDQLVGIGIAGGNTDRVVFNSISLTGDMDPGAASSSSTYGNAIRIPGANGTNNANFLVENNSIYLDVNSNTAANHFYAITLNSAAYSFGTGALNNNNYFINAANPQLRTGGLGTGTGNTPGTEFATLANWQAALTAPQDGASIQSDPLYLSNTSDLHLIGSSPNIDVGVAVAGVANDIDMQARPNGGGHDIGADEFYATPGTLQFSSATYSVTEAAMTATITVTRAGGSSGAISVDYMTSDGTAMGGAACGGTTDYINASGTLLWANNDIASKTFTVTVCLDGITEGNQTVNLALLNPTGGATVGSPGAAVLTILDSVLFGSSVNVGAAETYTSLTNPGGLFEAMNNGSFGPTLTVNITSDLTAETGAVSLNQLTGNPSVTIRPSGGARTISGSSGTNALIDLNGADNITIDGTIGPIQNVVAAGGSLTIRNTNNAASAVIRLINDASNNVIENCNIEGGTLSGNVLISTGTTTGNDNNIITNNTVRDRTDAAGVPFNDIINAGTSAAIANSNTIITNNQCLNFTQSGLLLFAGNEDSTVSGNDISQTASRTTGMFSLGVQAAFGTNVIFQNTIHDISTNGTNATRGIFLADARNTTVYNNSIYNFPSFAAATGEINGIEFDGGSGLPSSVTLVNNMVSIVPTVSTNQRIRGIYDFGFTGNTFNAFYNSIYLGGVSSGTSASWAMGRGIIAATTYTAKNNLCYNDRTGGGANHFADGDY